MDLTQVESRIIRCYRELKDGAGYGRLEIRVEGGRGVFLRTSYDEKIEKLDDHAAN